MNTETSEASRIRPTTLADMDPSAREAHMNDARIMAHITMVREDMGKLSRDMEAFNLHPEIMKASQNAEKYGMPQAAALHQALDQNPKLKDAFLKLHDRAMAIQPKVENAMDMAQGLSPKHSGTAEASLQHGLEGIQKQAAHWPDPADIGEQNSNTAKGQPGLVAMIGHLLKRPRKCSPAKNTRMNWNMATQPRRAISTAKVQSNRRQQKARRGPQNPPPVVPPFVASHRSPSE